MKLSQRVEIEQWWLSPLGQTVFEMEKALLTELSTPFYGHTQLQLGGIEPVPVLSKFLTSTFLSSKGDLNAKADSLPFKPYSIDNLLLLHVIEYQHDPHQVLREAERVLTEDGKLILLSFSPVSLWGLQRLFSWQDKAPWHGRFYSKTRIKDWLALLNFEIQEEHHTLYRPTFESEKWLHRTRFFERLGKRLWPWFGSVSIIVATKRTMPVNPIKAKHIRSKLFAGPRLVNKPIARENKNG